MCNSVHCGMTLEEIRETGWGGGRKWDHSIEGYSCYLRTVGRDEELRCVKVGVNTRDASSEWECLECGHVWTSSSNNIFKGRGCYRCNRGHFEPTIKFANQKLADNGRGNELRCVKAGVNTRDTFAEWECLKCGYVWTTAPNKALSVSGCYRCNRGHFEPTIKFANQKLADNGRGDELRCVKAGVNTGDASAQWECLGCGYVWSTAPTSIFARGSGCYRCNIGHFESTIEFANQKLADNGRGDELRSVKAGAKVMDASAEWECLECGYFWTAIPNDVLNSGQGCPSCASCRAERMMRQIIHGEGYDAAPFKHQELRDIKPLEIDAYSETLNSLFECDGGQHTDPDHYHNSHSESRFENNLRRDAIKDNFVTNKGLLLIRINHGPIAHGIGWDAFRLAVLTALELAKHTDADGNGLAGVYFIDQHNYQSRTISDFPHNLDRNSDEFWAWAEKANA